MTSFNLRQLAIECARESNGNTGKGAELLLDRLQAQQPKFYAERVREAMKHWAQGQIQAARTSVRASQARGCSNSRSESPMVPGRSAPIHQGVSARSLEAVRDTWYDWPIAGVGALGEATRPDILKAAANYLSNSKTFGARGAFLQSIAKKLADDTTPVRKAVTLATLQRYADQHHVTR